jgi:hypothetical protein
VGGQHHTWAALPLGERPGTHCTGGWMGQCGWVWKISPPPEFYFWTAQPMVCHYTECSLPACDCTGIVMNKPNELSPTSHTGEWCVHQFYNMAHGTKD